MQVCQCLTNSSCASNVAQAPNQHDFVAEDVDLDGGIPARLTDVAASYHDTSMLSKFGSTKTRWLPFRLGFRMCNPIFLLAPFLGAQQSLVGTHRSHFSLQI